MLLAGVVTCVGIVCLQCPSFLHMHLGIDATGLSPDLDCHHLVVNDWNSLEDALNVCIASIPTQFDPALAPPGDYGLTAGLM